jgi:integrase
VWQCRFKLEGQWQRATTKHYDLRQASDKALELRVEAEIRRRSNLPFISRNFRHVAKLAVQRMRDDTAVGNGKISYVDYIRVIGDYLIPFFASYKIGNIDRALLEQFDEWRIKRMGKTPSHSTLLTQNAALNRVFDEAVLRCFLTNAQKPKLAAKGKAGQRRPAFDLHEIHAMFAYFPAWIERARTDLSKELRTLLRDFVEVLLDTGARPGDELLNLKWKQVKYAMKQLDGDELNRSCEMVVDGKTGERTILGMNPTVKAFARIIERNYGKENPANDPFNGIAVTSNPDYVFRTKGKKKPTSFQRLFTSFLDEHDLLTDPKTGRERVFYSLRHTYATLALTHDHVSIHTLAKQMGTSVLMIEKHYSHLDTVKAIEQLRNYETRRLIAAGSGIEHTFVPKGMRVVRE